MYPYPQEIPFAMLGSALVWLKLSWVTLFCFTKCAPLFETLYFFQLSCIKPTKGAHKNKIKGKYGFCPNFLLGFDPPPPPIGQIPYFYFLFFL
jgi:hypothetical protein